MGLEAPKHQAVLPAIQAEEEHYSEKYKWVSVKVADGEVNSYKRRGMPITTLLEMGLQTQKLMKLT